MDILTNVKNKETRAANRLFLVLVIMFTLFPIILYSIVAVADMMLKAVGSDFCVLDWYKKILGGGFGSLIFSQMLILVPVIIFLIIKKKNVFEVLRIKKIPVSNVFLLIIIAFSIVPIVSLVNYISMMFVRNEISTTVNDIAENSSYISMLMALALLPGVVEEIAFRGVIYNAHRKTNMKKAILFSGILFGLFHMNFNQCAYAFLIGVLFAILVEITDSIVSTIIVHFVFNGISVTTTYFTSEISNTATETTNMEIPEGVYNIIINVVVIGILLMVSMVCAVIVYGCMYLIAKSNKKTDILNEIMSFSRKNNKSEIQNINTEIQHINIEETRSEIEENGLNTLEYESGNNDNRIVNIEMLLAILVCVLQMFLIQFSN